MDDACSTWQLIAAAGLIAFNAFLVASEFAFAKVQPTRLRELADQGNHRAEIALDITRHLNAYFSANRIGITFASVALGWTAKPVVLRLFGIISAPTPDGLAPSHALAGAAGLLMVSLLHMVAGELAPRSVSIQKAESLALRMAVPLRLFYVLSSPVVRLLHGATNGLLRLLGMRDATDPLRMVHTEEEIRATISSYQERGVLEEHEVVLVENVLDFTDRVAREIMTPRTDVSVLFTDETPEEAVKVALLEGHTRYPLCRGDRDHVVGVVHIRDIFALYSAGEGKSLIDIAREPLIIPETLPLNQVQQRFQLSGTPLALVVDEYGAFSGIVTLEDLIEEVFGEFRDEFDKEEPEIRATDDGLELDAGMLVEEVMEALGIESEVDVEGVDTIGGLVFSILGDRPRVGDVVSFEGYQLAVTSVEGLRITRVKATPVEDANTEFSSLIKTSRVSAS